MNEIAIALASITKKSRDILIPSKEYTLEVLPVDFEKFMWAMNYDITIDIIKEHYYKLKQLGKIIRCDEKIWKISFSWWNISNCCLICILKRFW